MQLQGTVGKALRAALGSGLCTVSPLRAAQLHFLSRCTYVEEEVSIMGMVAWDMGRGRKGNEMQLFLFTSARKPERKVAEADGMPPARAFVGQMIVFLLVW